MASDWVLIEYRPGRFAKVTPEGAFLEKATETEVKAWFAARERRLGPAPEPGPPPDPGELQASEPESQPSPLESKMRAWFAAQRSQLDLASEPEPQSQAPEVSSAQEPQPEPELAAPPPDAEHKPSDVETPSPAVEGLLTDEEDQLPDAAYAEDTQPEAEPAAPPPDAEHKPSDAETPSPEVEDLLTDEEDQLPDAAHAEDTQPEAEPAVPPSDDERKPSDEEDQPPDVEDTLPDVGHAEDTQPEAEPAAPPPDAERKPSDVEAPSLDVEDLLSDEEEQPPGVEDQPLVPPTVKASPKRIQKGTGQRASAVTRPEADTWDTDDAVLPDNTDRWLWVDPRQESGYSPSTFDLGVFLRRAVELFQAKTWTGGQKPRRLAVHPNQVADGLGPVAEALGMEVIGDPLVTPGTYRLGLAEMKNGGPS